MAVTHRNRIFLQIRTQQAKTSVIRMLSVLKPWRTIAMLPSENHTDAQQRSYTSTPECIVFGAFCRYEFSRPKQVKVLNILPLKKRSAPLRCCRVKIIQMHNKEATHLPLNASYSGLFADTNATGKNKHYQSFNRGTSLRCC